MQKVIYIRKPIGITPLKAIEIFKQKYPKYKNETISYAGRLDPMAEGALVLLIGKENKKRDKYLKLDKVYESEIVLGISTDSFDSLGKIQKVFVKDIAKKDIKSQLNKFVGKNEQIYPPYSSKTVKGKPLYWWARNKRIDEIDIPSREIEIYAIELLSISLVNSENLSRKIIKNINKLKGDFRQIEIIEDWKKFQIKNQDNDFTIIKIKVSCSSGTYIRKIASDLGIKLGIGAFAFSIKRTGLGEYEKNQELIIL